MFIGSSIFDLKLTIFLLILSFVVSFFIYIISKKKLFSIFVLSLLCNTSVYLTVLSDSRMFNYYNIDWFKIFTINYWLYINVFLFLLIILNYFKEKNVYKKKN